MKFILFIIVLAVVGLAVTNPDEAKFREHVKQKTGIAGSVGMAVADAITGDKKGAVKRDNYLVASRFYVGGDGIIPRADLAWGVAGQFFETDKGKK